MTKADFVTAVKASVVDNGIVKTNNDNFTKGEIEDILNAVLDTIVENVSAGEKVGFMGFGSFEMVECKEKDGVNPKTGEKITIAAHNKVKFTPSKQFKERVN